MHEAARARVEGTRDGMERIANELGIRRQTLHAWHRRFGWQRPAPAVRLGPAGAPLPRLYRSRRFGRPYGGDAVGTARDLVLGSHLSLRRIAVRVGIDLATLHRWKAKNGWTRPPALLARRPRPHPPYGADVIAEARELYCTTELSTRMIAARARTTRERVRFWARREGWTRLSDMPDPDGGVRRRGRRRA